MPWPLPALLGVIGGMLLALGQPLGLLPVLVGAALGWREANWQAPNWKAPNWKAPNWKALLLAFGGAVIGFFDASYVQARPNPMTPWIGGQVTLTGYWDGQFLNLTDPKARVSLAPKPAHAPGTMRVSGRLERPSGPRTPGGFNQAAWLRAQGGLLTPTPGSVLVAARVRQHQPERGPRGWFRRGLASGLSPRQAALMQAIELGDRGDIGREEFDDGLTVRDAFSRAGLAHLMALSGQNVALLTGAMMLLIGFFKVPPWVRYAIPAALLLPYLLVLVGASPSITRAVIMGLVGLLSLLIGRGKPDPLGAIALAALVCLLLFPPWLQDLGFQLSFLAVLGLTLSPALADRLPQRWPRALRLALSATLLAELATLPLIASTFGQIPVVGLPANLLAELLMILLVPLGMLAGLLGPAGFLVNWLVGPLASALLGVAEFFGHAPVLPWGFVSPAGYLAYAVAGAGGVLWLRGRVSGRLASTIALTCAALTLLPGRLNPPRELVYLDVGQGDSTLLRLPGFNMLVDGGGSVGSDYDVGGRTVVPALRSLGVQQLDVVVATHADTDHIEGLSSVLRQVKVGELWIGHLKEADPVLEALLRAARERNVPVRQVRRGDQIKVAGATMTVVWPRGQFWSVEDNENSVALTLESKGWRTALLGDLPDPAESLLGLGQLDLLKAAHHGSRSSTSAELLRQTTPQDAIISVGRNTYGHPHPEVLGRLQAAQVKVWRTDQVGTIRWPIP